MSAELAKLDQLARELELKLARAEAEIESLRCQVDEARLKMVSIRRGLLTIDAKISMMAVTRARNLATGALRKVLSEL